MGKEQSKEEIPEPEPQTINAAEIDSSSGFHILEIHTATSVFGAGVTIFIIVIIFVIWYLVRRCRKNRRRLPVLNPYVMTPHGPMQHGLPPLPMNPVLPTMMPPYSMPAAIPAAVPPEGRYTRRQRRPRGYEERFEEVEEGFDEE